MRGGCAISFCLVSALVVQAADFGVPYEIDFTDSSGRTLFPGGGIAATSKNSDSVDLWSIGLGGVLVNAAAWTTTNGWSKTSPFLPFVSTRQFKPGGGIAADVRVPNTNMVDTFVLGDKGYLWNAGSFDGTNWHPPYQAPPWASLPVNAFVKGGGLAVNSRLATVTDAFTIGNDSCLWYAGGWDSSHGFKAPFKWSTAARCVFIPGGGIAVNSRTSAMNDTWAIGRDGYLWNAGSFDGSFHPPYPHPIRLPHAFTAGAPVAAVSRDSTRVDVYAFDPDGSLWMVGGFVNGTPVAPYRVPTSIPGSFLAAQGGAQGLPLGGIAATSRNAGVADTWAIAPDGSAWNAGYWVANEISGQATVTCSHLPLPAHAVLTPPRMPPRVAYTRRLGRLTSGPQTNAVAANVSGVDLGAAVELPGGNLAFLFGDTRLATKEGNGVDSLGLTNAQRVGRDQMPTLTYSMIGGQFFSIFGRDQIDLGVNNTPQDGVSLPGGRVIVFAGTGSELVNYDHSTMAVTATMQTPPSPVLSLNHVVKSEYFFYVSTLYDPSDGFIYIFGTGPDFRQSDWVHLARVPANCVGDRSSWTYFTGNVKSTFEFGEINAQPLFNGPNPGLGELSVRKIGSGYVMLYQSGPTPRAPNADRGVFARFATTVAGFWSAPVKIWAPGPVGGLFAGIGYGSSMHSGEGPPPGWVNYDDGLSEPNATLNPPVDRHEIGGGEYAPQLIPAWSSAAQGVTKLTFDLSLWNPYEADLFESVLTDGSAGGPPPTLPTGSQAEQPLTNPQFEGTDPLRGWSLSGGPFVTVDMCGSRYLSTYGPLGGATLGSMQQTFVPGPHTTKVCASILGGSFNTPQFKSTEPNVSLRLIRDGVVVRESRPKSNNSDPRLCSVPSDLPRLVAWDLTEFVGESVTLEIHDNRQDALGFMLISALQQGTNISADGDCLGEQH